MPLFRNVQTVLSMSAASNQDQAGTAYRVVPNEGDQVLDHDQVFQVFFDVTQSGGASSPTTDVSLETSHDGSSWFKLVGATQRTADGTTHEWKAATAVGPWVRATTALGGGTKPNHQVTVKLASSAPFKLRTT
jgi:hypothetical protein